MGTVELKNIIKASLKTEDTELLKQIVEVIINYRLDSNNSGSVLNDFKKKELDKIREKHISVESKSYTWKEIKQELLTKNEL